MWTISHWELNRCNIQVKAAGPCGTRACLLHCSVTMVDKLVSLPKVTQGEYYLFSGVNRISLVAQTVKCLPKMWETWVRSLSREDPLEKEIATHSSIHAWKIPWTEEPLGLQSMGSQRVRQDQATSLSLSAVMTTTVCMCYTWLEGTQGMFFL